MSVCVSRLYELCKHKYSSSVKLCIVVQYICTWIYIYRPICPWVCPVYMSCPFLIHRCGVCGRTWAFPVSGKIWNFLVIVLFKHNQHTVPCLQYPQLFEKPITEIDSEKPSSSQLKGEIQWSGKFHSYDKYCTCEMWEQINFSFFCPLVFRIQFPDPTFVLF
jgi:hypothetical protein